MKERSDAPNDWDALRAKIIGLGERSTRKSYYPELERRLGELERFRALLDQSNDLIFLAQVPSGHFADVNESACRQLGHSHKALLGMSVDELVPESIGEEMAAFLADEDQIGQDGKTIVTAFSCDSGEMLVEMSVRLVAFNDAVYAVIVARDITARKRAEEERERFLTQIRQQARRLQQILATVPEGVLLLDAERRITLANPVAEEELPTLADAAMGEPLTRLGDRPLDELLTSPPTEGLWHEVKGGDGRTFEVIARPMQPALSLSNGNGAEPEDWVLVVRDVTQEREVERHTRQQERLAAVGQLAAGVAHDFNNIMSTIVLYAQMMSRTEGLSARSQEQLATIDDQARQATDLIQEILDFSRRAVLEKQPLDLLPLLKEQVKLLERTLPENIQIDLAYGPGEHTVSADPTRIQQAVMNLAVNARDAMPDGGTLRIGLERIKVERGQSPLLPEMEAGEWIRLTVSDTGEGIPADVLPHIFEPFFTTKGPGGGSGLGLAQVHGIVGQHEGRIGIETQVEEGTTFTIYLPALAVQPPEPLSSELSELAQGHGETILVVEDNVNTRQALVASLEGLGYRVVEVANGDEALETLEDLQVELVLSDVVMPRMGGIALLHALRERGSVVPLVLLTGHPMEEELEGLREAGLSDWLFKPPSLARLAQVVSQALSQ